MKLQKTHGLAFFFFFSSLLCLYSGLSEPNQLFWDEIIHVNGARSVLYGNKPYPTPYHPPLGREILLSSLYIFGDTPQGARGISILAGAGCVALVFLIAFRLTQSLFFASVSALSLLTDTLFYLHARMGMFDIFVAFFMVLSFWVFLWMREKPPPRPAYPYYLLGTALALAFAIKVVAGILYPIFFIDLLLTALKCKERREKRREVSHLFFGFFIPALFFFWLPYAIMGYSLQGIKDHLVWVWEFMHTFKGSPSVISGWKEWLLVKKPIWYLNIPVDKTHMRSVVATGNYLLWIGAEIFFVILLFNWKRLPKKIFFVHAVIAAQLAFWAIKPTTHIYYMLPIIPFYALLVGVFFRFLADRFPAKSRYIQWDAAIYLACCFVIFGYYFPLIHGSPVERMKVNQYLFPGTDAPGTDEKTSLTP